MKRSKLIALVLLSAIYATGKQEVTFTPGQLRYRFGGDLTSKTMMKAIRRLIKDEPSIVLAMVPRYANPEGSNKMETLLYLADREGATLARPIEEVRDFIFKGDFGPPGLLSEPIEAFLLQDSPSKIDKAQRKNLVSKLRAFVYSKGTNVQPVE